jgi:hypothetical protein
MEEISLSFLVRSAKGHCQQVLPAALGKTSKYVLIRNTVGKGGVNKPDEVLKIQRALNQLSPGQQAAFCRLDEEGLAGGTASDENGNTAIQWRGRAGSGHRCVDERPRG